MKRNGKNSKDKKEEEKEGEGEGEGEGEAVIPRVVPVTNMYKTGRGADLSRANQSVKHMKMPETEILAYVKLIYKRGSILNPQGLMALNGVKTLVYCCGRKIKLIINFTPLPRVISGKFQTQM